MARGALERKKRRMPCDVRFEGRRHSGLVLDLSPSGLFIQTGAKAGPGAPLDLDLSVPGEAQKLRLQAEVVRQRVVPARLRTVAQGGVGVRILNAPEAYYRFMGLLGIGEDAEVDSAAARASARAGRGDATAASEVVEPKPASGRATDSAGRPGRTSRFRVRVSQIGGSRSRRLDLTAKDEKAARAQALAAAGVGWRVLEVEPV
jgi:hypothetical protein